MSSSSNPPAGGRESKTSRLGYGIAKVLKIDLPPQPKYGNGSLDDEDTYIEEDPTVGEWVKDHSPTVKGVWNFLVGLFPFVNWIGKYNRVWFMGDVIAGVTVGTVVVPQSSLFSISSQRQS